MDLFVSSHSGSQKMFGLFGTWSFSTFFTSSQHWSL